MAQLLEFLAAVPALAVYLIVGLIVGVESLGVPLPGETVLVAVILLSRSDGAAFSAFGVGVGAAIGAIVGDSIGYFIGRRLGQPLLNFLGRKFPRHFSAIRVAYVQHLLVRWGWPVVFFGRWVALLHILCGPLAGAAGMPYRKFLPANVGGGITWVGIVSAAIWALGEVAEVWLHRAGWVVLLLVVVAGLVAGKLLGSVLDAKVVAYAKEQAAEHLHVTDVTPEAADEASA